EKTLIFLDRPAHSAAVLMPAKRRDGLIEEVPGVESAVAVEIVGAPVKLVRARLGDGVDDATGTPAVLGRVIVGEHRELADGIHSQVHAQGTSRAAVGVVVDDHSIDPKGVVGVPATGNVKGHAVAALGAAKIVRILGGVGI